MEWRISNSNDYLNQTLGSTLWKGIPLSGAVNRSVVYCNECV